MCIHLQCTLCQEVDMLSWILKCCYVKLAVLYCKSEEHYLWQTVNFHMFKHFFLQFYNLNSQLVWQKCLIDHLELTCHLYNSFILP